MASEDPLWLAQGLPLIWNKLAIKHLLIARLTEDLTALRASARDAHEGATHSEAQAKSKYDTHGLELAYLAGSQYERARAIEMQIQQLQRETFASFGRDDLIDVGAIVTLRSRAQVETHFFLSPWGAGLRLSLEHASIQVLSPESPLGEKLLGLGLDDQLPLSPAAEDLWQVSDLV